MGEVIAQANAGWLAPPMILLSSRQFAMDGAVPMNTAARRAPLQLRKVWAFGDAKYVRVNPSPPGATLIKFPTIGHIGRICVDVLGQTPHGFLKEADKSGYKKFSAHLRSGKLNPATSSLRNVTSGMVFRWKHCDSEQWPSFIIIIASRGSPMR